MSEDRDVFEILVSMMFMSQEEHAKRPPGSICGIGVDHVEEPVARRLYERLQQAMVGDSERAERSQQALMRRRGDDGLWQVRMVWVRQPDPSIDGSSF